jgi:hypothetical protein
MPKLLEFLAFSLIRQRRTIVFPVLQFSFELSTSHYNRSMHPSSSLSSQPSFAGLTGQLAAMKSQRAAARTAKEGRRRRARTRLRRSDHVIGVASLVGAAAAMPLAASPEAAAILAVASMALLAGQRWAIGVVMIAQLALLAALLPFVVAHPPPSPMSTAAAWLSVVAAFPCLAATRRGAAALALLSGVRRTRATCRVIHVAALVLTVIAGCAPLL